MKQIKLMILMLGFATTQLEAQMVRSALPQEAAPQQQQSQQTSPQDIAREQVNLQASAVAADNWLKYIDAGKYGESWDAASNIFRFTIKRDEWIKAEDKLRKPFGRMISRQLVEQRPAKNPQGLPEGDYMVLLYKSSFQEHPQVNELVTMVLSTDGQWKVLTYQASF